jgi:hypothetical protein
MINKFLNKLCFVIIMFVYAVVNGENLPKGAVSLEAEEYFSKEAAFEVESCIHTSAGKYIKGKEGNKITSAVMVVQASFPESDKTYSLWARAKNLKLGVKSSLLEMREFNTISKDWKWHKLGEYNSKIIGSSFSIYAIPDENNQLSQSGIDSIVITPGKDRPSGIYASALGPQNDSADGGKNLAGNILKTDVDIYTNETRFEVSSYIASANAHLAQRHLLNNKGWDKTMKYFFSGNLLVLLERAKKEPDENGQWWDFKKIDAFVNAAAGKWGVKDIMIMPQWWLKWEDKEKGPTAAQMAAGSEIVMQLVRRYGTGKSPQIKYWVISDEWPCGGYWRKNYKQFVEYYALIVNKIKDFNSQLKIGGPVDCWPNDMIIAELLQKCPNLDFIAWNIFIIGRADIPLKKLFQRTSYIKVHLKSSQELSRKILGHELPVMISSYGSNYHAWNPPDYQLAQPINGVWNTLALNYMVGSKCFSGVFYNIVAQDCGLFGPNDPFAKKGNMVSAATDPEKINIRPVGRVHYFFKKNIADGKLNKLKITGNKDKFSIISTIDDKGYQSIAMVNFSESYRLVTIKSTPFSMPLYSDFDLPSEYIYCDEFSFRSGKGFFFCAKGQAKLYMPPYSSYCIKTKCITTKKENGSKL